MSRCDSILGQDMPERRVAEPAWTQPRRHRQQDLPILGGPQLCFQHSCLRLSCCDEGGIAQLLVQYHSKLRNILAGAGGTVLLLPQVLEGAVLTMVRYSGQEVQDRILASAVVKALQAFRMRTPAEPF